MWLSTNPGATKPPSRSIDVGARELAAADVVAAQPRDDIVAHRHGGGVGVGGAVHPAVDQQRRVRDRRDGWRAGQSLVTGQNYVWGRAGVRSSRAARESATRRLVRQGGRSTSRTSIDFAVDVVVVRGRVALTQPAPNSVVSVISGTRHRRPRIAMAVNPGPATARTGGTSSNSPSAVVTSPGNQDQAGGQGDHRAVAQRRARFGQAGSQLPDLTEELRPGQRRQQAPPEHEGGQQHQQGPAPPDRRHQRDDHRELDDGVDE